MCNEKFFGTLPNGSSQFLIANCSFLIYLHLELIDLCADLVD